MNILLTAFGDPDNPKTWSKTPYAIKEVLRKDNVVETFDMSKLKTSGISLFQKFLGKMRIAGSHLTRSPFVYKFYSNGLEKVLAETKMDVVLFAAEHCLGTNKKRKVKCYEYIDCLLRPIYDVDPSTNIIQKLTLPLYERNDKKSFQEMDMIFTLTEWVRTKIIRDYGISPEKVKNVGFGVNLKPYYGSKDYEQNRLLIVLRKGMEYRKGLPLLLEAFKIIKATIPNATLDIVGTEGPSYPGVTYYYNQSHDVTVNLFQKCTLYTMPAIYEPCGNTYLEALANRAPIVGLNRFAIPEFTGNGKWGFIANEEKPETVANVIIDALSDIERLKEMGEAGQKFVIENYTWEIAVKKMLDYIKQDISNGKIDKT